jgi:heme-degrading monooxygenase HmoA
MAVLVMLEVAGGTVEKYAEVNELLGIGDDDNAPDGLIYHVAAVSDDGLVMTDLWRSEEDFERFFDERAGEAMAQAEVGDVKHTVAQVHDHTDGTGSEEATLVIIESDDLTPEMYDRMRAEMPSHAEGNDHPAVAHIAAIKPDGGFVVVDVWESPEAFAAFAQSEIGPAGASVGLGAVEPRIHPIHNTIKSKSTTTQ